MKPSIVVADTSVIINFLRVDRMDLIGRHPASFIATNHVAEEIADAYPEQQDRYAFALRTGYLGEERVDDPREVELFLRLGATGRLGAGERSAIAVALTRNCDLAIDDTRAINRALREAGCSGRPLKIVRTQDIVVTLIRAGDITIEIADVIKETWASQHRFRLRFNSFRDIVRGTNID